MDEPTLDGPEAWVRMVGLLEFVALGPERQMKLFTTDHRGPDLRATDLADAANDARAIGQTLHAAGVLTWRQYESVAQMRAYVDGLNDEPGSADVWSDAAVISDPRWDRVRALAREALTAVTQA